MKKTRKVIEIDEEKCTGCGNCIVACAEGALKIVDGKARLVSDVYCDGLGACLGECPEGALKIVEREAEEFSEAAVKERTAQKPEQKDVMPCGCPSSMAMNLKPKLESSACDCQVAKDVESELGHWPVKIQLLNPNAEFLKGAELVILADCCAAAMPNLHRDILKGRAIAMGCPKLDNIEAHVSKLAEIIKTAKPRLVRVVHMEVPCCQAFVIAAEMAIAKAGIDTPLTHTKIARTDEVLESGPVKKN